MATHSSIFAWRIPQTEEPGGLQSMGLQRVRHNWVTELWHNLLLSDGTGCHDLSFRILSFRPAFSLSSFILIKRIFSSLHFLPLGLYHLLICGCWYFSWQPWFQVELYPVKHFTWCTLHRHQISRLTIYILDPVLSQFWTSLFFQVCF